jgi:hypothetical protein
MLGRRCDTGRSTGEIVETQHSKAEVQHQKHEDGGGGEERRDEGELDGSLPAAIRGRTAHAR